MGVGETKRSPGDEREVWTNDDPIWFGSGCRTCGSSRTRELDEARPWLGEVCESCGDTL